MYGAVVDDVKFWNKVKLIILLVIVAFVFWVCEDITTNPMIVIVPRVLDGWTFSRKDVGY